MRPRTSFDDTSGADRAVSEVIGSILVFGLLVALLALVQTQVVPSANEDVEATHAADVQGDLADLQSSISRSAALGSTESTTVATGTTYPPRLVLFNPPPVQGTLRTGESSDVLVDRFTAPNPDTAFYFVRPGAGQPLNFTTHTVSYDADYNRYEGPTTHYEHSVLVNRYGNGTTVESEGSLVNGNRISLTLLRGGLQESRVNPASVTTYPVSAPSQTVTVETGDSATGQVLIPTNLPEEVWVSEILADQIDTNALPGDDLRGCDSLNEVGPAGDTTDADTDDDRYVVSCEYGERSDAPNQLLIEFQSESTYELRTAKVGFSASSETPEPAYVTEVTAAGANRAVVEVRDRFSNPVEQPVDLVVDPDPGDDSTRSLTTDENGRAELPSDVGAANVYIEDGSYDPDGSTPCLNAFQCAVATGAAQPAASAIRVSEVRSDGNDEVTFVFSNTGDDSTTIQQVQLGYATQREERSFTLSGDALVGFTDDQSFSSSLVTDGPDSITQLSDGSDTFTPVSGSGSPPGAKENLSPVAFRTGGNPDGDALELNRGASKDVTFTLNEDITLAGEDSVDLSVTVYYADGSSATYSRTLFQEDGERGQSP